jgi:hypothetical protein
LNVETELNAWVKGGDQRKMGEKNTIKTKKNNNKRGEDKAEKEDGGRE